MDAILDACKKTGAQAVHPGYGFLSEKYSFAELLDKNNITFVGPSRKSLYLMGDKIESKRCAAKAGVSTVPGFDGVVASAEEAVDISRGIGYPVMIKAAGGGGGKGMRIAYNDEEARQGFRLSLAEAKSSFNDDRILVEKFIEDPRHIEFQVLGDKLGNVIHLNERECSVQRRNQKLLEEAPSPALDPDTRRAIGAQAVALAKAAKYYSAGTVEFLLDRHRKFYFLEMNTRLQVEHPITEMITGVDIVEQMIRVAAGQPLSLSQSDVKINGWAIENRINSENPYRNLGTPSIGRIFQYSEPVHLENVRIDSGIQEGSEISMFYDSMIAKSICHGTDRAQALALSRRALDRFVIRGVTHNVSLLRDIMDEKDFASGNFTTKYLQLKYPDGFHGRKLSTEESHHVVAGAIFNYISNERRNFFVGMDVTPQLETAFRRHMKDRELQLIFESAGKEHSFSVTINDIGDESRFSIKIDGSSTANQVVIADHNTYYTEALVDDEPVVFQVSRVRNTYKVQLYGTAIEVRVLTKLEHELSQKVVRNFVDESEFIIASPMQGVVISVSRKPGDEVHVGDEVAVVEAMKMQNSITAHRSGKIKSVAVKVGDKVGDGEIIVELE